MCRCSLLHRHIPDDSRASRNYVPLGQCERMVVHGFRIFVRKLAHFNSFWVCASLGQSLQSDGYEAIAFSCAECSSTHCHRLLSKKHCTFILKTEITFFLAVSSDLIQGFGTAADHHVHHKLFKYNYGHLFMWVAVRLSTSSLNQNDANGSSKSRKQYVMQTNDDVWLVTPS